MNRNWKFTLLELLMVIAVIIILASLLLPALRNARNLSKAVGCLNNIHQTHVGTALYASDFNGYAPFYKPWYTTASLAVISGNPNWLTESSSSPAFLRAFQMLENGYWLPGHLQCPARERFDPSNNCFAVNEFYKKKNVVAPDGTPAPLASSYALKSCAINDWKLPLIDDPNANLSYKLGQKPSEVLIMDFFYLDYWSSMHHPRKFVIAYEDGMGKAVNVKAVSFITASSGSADRFMNIIKCLSRNYNGAVTW